MNHLPTGGGSCSSTALFAEPPFHCIFWMGVSLPSAPEEFQEPVSPATFTGTQQSTGQRAFPDAMRWSCDQSPLGTSLVWVPGRRIVSVSFFFFFFLPLALPFLTWVSWHICLSFPWFWCILFFFFLFATFGEKIGDPLKNESFTTRGSIIFPRKLAQQKERKTHLDPFRCPFSVKLSRHRRFGFAASFAVLGACRNPGSGA